jgi:tetratricopeptide (TPR) repeat protein
MRAEKTSLLKEIDDQITIHKTSISELIKKAEEQRELTELWIDGQFAVNRRDYDMAIKIYKEIYDRDGSKLAWELYAESLFQKARDSSNKSNYKELLAKAKKEYMKMEDRFKDGECAWFLARIASLQDDEPECKKWLEYGSEHKTLPSKEDLSHEIIDIKKYNAKDWMQSIVWGARR